VRHLAAFVALVAFVGIAAPAFAADDSPTARRRASRAERTDAPATRRSSTVAPNGTCQRDNGRPLDSLRLNHECDRREFWDRMNERGGDRN
jgi:hypothetical protein